MYSKMTLRQADEVLEKLWDRDVTAWRKYWVHVFHVFACELVDYAKIAPGQLVLDIGTGSGVAAVAAARKLGCGGFVIGIDRSPRILDVARKTTQDSHVRFFRMNAEDLYFPDEMFDAILSNCGIAHTTFPRAISEIFRVLRPDGIFAFNDWRLLDVPVHRAFSSILQEHRTEAPSGLLRLQRTALAVSEHVANSRFNKDRQLKDLRDVGFKQIEVKQIIHRIRLRGIQDYLAMRFERAALRQELKELSRTQRSKLMGELRLGLKRFLRDGNFVIDWPVSYTRAKKAA